HGHPANSVRSPRRRPLSDTRTHARRIVEESTGLTCGSARPGRLWVGAERGNAHGCWRSGMLACTLRLGLALALTQFRPEAGARLRPAARILVVSSLGSDATE